MLNVYEDRESRRFTILEGIGKNLSYLEIAAQLGVKRWIIRSDIRKMQYGRDPKLRQMYQKKKELIKANKQISTQKRDKRFYGMTGITFVYEAEAAFDDDENRFIFSQLLGIQLSKHLWLEGEYVSEHDPFP